MSKHRAARPRQVRARYGRIAAATVSLLVTAVALLGGVGVIPLDTDPSAATTNTSAGIQGAGTDTDSTNAKRQGSAQTPGTGSTGGTATTPPETVVKTDPAALPEGTGSGRRVVFSEEAQRVWLVNESNRVVSTYLVSGSLTDNLHPGSYAVYSRSRWAVGIDDSGVMQYFVRFTRGNNAAIGFHSIPSKNGTPLQTEAQLGTPQSHGCIRQKTSDAERMWDFAQEGTAVVVV